jgi:hypothetical protein
LVPTWEGELASDATIERRSIAPITVNRLVAVLEQVANALPPQDPLTILELAGTGYDPSQRLGERLARLSLLNLHPAGRAQLTGTGPLASLFRKLVRSPLVAEAMLAASGITARITITPHSARDAGAVLARAGQPGGAVVFDRNAVYEVSESELGAGGRRVIHLTELSPGRIKPEAPILAEPESVPAGRRVPSSRDTDDHRLAANSMPKLTNFTAVFGHGRGKRLESGTGVLREDQVGPLVKGAAGQAGLLAGCATTDLGEAIAETEQMDMLSTPGVLWFTTDGRATAREAEFDDDGTPVFREDLQGRS